MCDFTLAELISTHIFFELLKAIAIQSVEPLHTNTFNDYIASF
jgi:hypothetical protein